MEDQDKMIADTDQPEVEQLKSWIATGKATSFEETLNYNILTMTPPKDSSSSK